MVDVPDETGNLRRIPVPPDTLTLQRIAETTGARFFAAPSNEDLKDVYRELGSKIGFVKEKQEITVVFAASGLLFLVVLVMAMSLVWFSRFPQAQFHPRSPPPGSGSGSPRSRSVARPAASARRPSKARRVGGVLPAVPGPAEVAADQLEVGAEPVEVAAEAASASSTWRRLLDPQFRARPRSTPGRRTGWSARPGTPRQALTAYRQQESPGGSCAGTRRTPPPTAGSRGRVVGALVGADVLVGDGVDVPAWRRARTPAGAASWPRHRRRSRPCAQRLQRELGVDRDHRLAHHQHRVHPGPRAEHVLGPVGAVRQALGQELLQQQLPEGAPGLGRAQEVLQPAQPAGLLEDLLGHPATTATRSRTWAAVSAARACASWTLSSPR